MVPLGWFIVNVIGAGVAGYAGSKAGEGETVESVKLPPVRVQDEQAEEVNAGYLVAGAVLVGSVAALIMKKRG